MLLLFNLLVISHGVQPIFERSGFEVDFGDGLGDDLGAATLGLFAHLILSHVSQSPYVTVSDCDISPYHEFSTLDVFETRKVLYFIGGGQLPTRRNAESEETLVHNSYTSVQYSSPNVITLGKRTL